MLAGSITKGGLIDTFRTDRLDITRNQAGIAHIDGEPVELPDRLTIKCHHKGLKIFAPTKRSRFRPLFTPAMMFARDCYIRVSNLFSRPI